MIEIRRSADRGRTRTDWLDSYHTFSFGEYYDPQQQHFGALRVINEDRVAPSRGFGTHGHRDMEIITYVLEGQLSHRDSLGTGATIRPGEAQRMSAGTGIEHSETNLSPADAVHFLQIWIVPERKGLPPSYEQKQLVDASRVNQWQLLASPDAREGSITVQQDVLMSVGFITPGGAVTYAVAAGRQVWVQLACGQVLLNGELLTAGDGAGCREESTLTFLGQDPAEVLIFDLAV